MLIQLFIMLREITITRWICEATMYIVICRLPVSEIDDIVEPDEHQSMPDTQDTGAVTRSEA